MNYLELGENLTNFSRGDLTLTLRVSIVIFSPNFEGLKFTQICKMNSYYSTDIRHILLLKTGYHGYINMIKYYKLHEYHIVDISGLGVKLGSTYQVDLYMKSAWRLAIDQKSDYLSTRQCWVVSGQQMSGLISFNGHWSRTKSDSWRLLE